MSCTIDFQARRRKNCITIVVSEQNFNIVKGLKKYFMILAFHSTQRSTFGFLS